MNLAGFDPVVDVVDAVTEPRHRAVLGLAAVRRLRALSIDQDDLPVQVDLLRDVDAAWGSVREDNGGSMAIRGFHSAADVPGPAIMEPPGRSCWWPVWSESVLVASEELAAGMTSAASLGRVLRSVRETLEAAADLVLFHAGLDDVPTAPYNPYGYPPLIAECGAQRLGCATIARPDGIADVVGQTERHANWLLTAQRPLMQQACAML